MRKLVLGALVGAVALAGCGGSSKHISVSVPTTSTPATTTASTPTSTTATNTTPATTTTASTPTTPPATNTTPTTTTASTPSGGAAPGGPGTTSTPSVSFTPAEVAKAKQMLRACQANQPGITLQELEREAASPEGIQC